MKFYKQIDLSKIKVLSFDLDNTIYDCQTVLTRAENWFTTYLCERYGLGGKYLSYDYWAAVKSKVLHEDMSLEDDVTLLRAKSLVVAFKEIGIPLKGDLEEANALVKLFVQKRSDGVVADDVRSLMKELKDKYPLISVSNGNLDAKQLDVASYFETDLRPERFKFHRKPHADLFNESARFKNVAPSEILHIGDDPYTDVLGAVSAGCRCVWLRKGYTGISPDEKFLSVLPDIEIDDILELRQLLL